MADDKQDPEMGEWEAMARVLMHKAEKLEAALLFYTAGMGLYDGWTVDQLIDEMKAHGYAPKAPPPEASGCEHCSGNDTWGHAHHCPRNKV